MADKNGGCSCKKCFASLATFETNCLECGGSPSEDECKNVEKEEGNVDDPNGKEAEVYSNIR